MKIELDLLAFNEDESPIEYMGVLGNVGPDILKVRLDRGFRVVEMPERDAYELIAELEGISTEALSSFVNSYLISKDWKVYCVTNEFESWATTCGEDNEGNVIDPEYNDAGRVVMYLEPALQLLRLFTGRNACIPFEYYFGVNNGKRILERKSFHFCVHSIGSDFSIKDQELQDLQALLSRAERSFKQRFVELALHHYEASFQTEDRAQAFLSLFTSLEVLLQSSKGRDIAENVANLLGDSEESKQELRKEMSKLRSFRNSIVHEGVLPVQKGTKDWFHAEKLDRLREIVSSILLKVDSMGVDKHALLEHFKIFPDMAKSASKQDKRQPDISGS